MYALVSSAVMVQMMACYLIGAKPLSETILSFTIWLLETISIEIWTKKLFQLNTFHDVASKAWSILISPEYVQHIPGDEV